ncbi:MAG TPA: hypothetical protein VIF15_22145 [Polyangiaceae bacterium]|jgi:hypothetical protein
MRRRAWVCAAVLVALAPLAAQCSRTPPGPLPPAPHGIALPTYHFDRARTGWSDVESTLVPARVRGGLVRAWESPPLDGADVAYQDDAGAHADAFPPRLFATPLYLDDVVVSAGPFAGASVSVVLVATTSNWVYALAATDAPTADGEGIVPAGTILWRTPVGAPVYVPTLDRGMPLGVLGTPVVDAGASPPTMYVAAADAAAGWQVFALDVTSGAVRPGWPMAIDPAVVRAVDRNGLPGVSPPAMAGPTVASQRSALLLSPDGGTLFVAFGAYADSAVGWLVAVDVHRARVVTSFSSAAAAVAPGGGMWGAGGPAVSPEGRVYMTTGNAPGGSFGVPGLWGNSLLAWGAGLELAATYSPFNYCLLDAGDTDLGGSSPVTFDVDPGQTSTPHLATFGSKQGVVYLVDRDHLGGSLVKRPACDANPLNDDPATDASLYGPAPVAAYPSGHPGPLPVFGPYSDAPGDNDLDRAKMRTTPALFRPSSGQIFVYAAGTSRDPANLDAVVPPCVARLRLVALPGQHAYFEPAFLANRTAVLRNPGAPIVTSHDGGQDGVVWVLDQNARRTDPVVPKPGFVPAGAVLYAFDAATLETLWASAPGDLGPGGKYGHVVVAHGTVYVATDRVAAFVGKGAP